MGLLNLILAIWVYVDAKKFRRRGVPVKPGIIAGLIVFISYATTFFFGFGGGLFYSFIPRSVWRSLFGMGWFGGGVIIGVGIPLVIYLLLRFLKYEKVAALGGPPLPPAPKWSFWLFIGLLVLPLLLVGVFILFILFELGAF